MEIWRDIKNYENSYQISTEGRVKSLTRKDSNGHNVRERILKLGLDNYGYPLISLYRNHNKKTFKVHRLVAQIFILNPNNKPEVNHKSGIKIDNEVDNLEWVTHKENMKHSFDKLGRIALKGENSVNSKLTEIDVLQIRESNLTQKELAEIFGISFQHVSAIKNNKVWRHLHS